MYSPRWGFTRVNPVSGDYMIGSPLFTKLTLTLPAASASSYRRRATRPTTSTSVGRLNGEPLDIPIVTYRQINAGGLLEFDMGPAPSSWGAAWRGTPLADEATLR